MSRALEFVKLSCDVFCVSTFFVIRYGILAPRQFDEFSFRAYNSVPVHDHILDVYVADFLLASRVEVLCGRPGQPTYLIRNWTPERVSYP